jgi:hypothetical protein
MSWQSFKVRIGNEQRRVRKAESGEALCLLTVDTTKSRLWSTGSKIDLRFGLSLEKKRGSRFLVAEPALSSTLSLFRQKRQCNDIGLCTYV